MNKLRHERGCENIHSVEIQSCHKTDPFALFEPFKNRGRKHGKAAGDVGDKGYDADAGNGDTVHGQKACIEYAGDEDVEKRAHYGRAKAYETAFAVVVFRRVNVFERKHQIIETEYPFKIHKSAAPSMKNPILRAHDIA